jgi:hypothetical protein
MSSAATSPVELWYSVHRHGPDLCLSPGWPTKADAIATGHMKAGKFLGVICSGWLYPSASAAEVSGRAHQLQSEMDAQIGRLKEQLAEREKELAAVNRRLSKPASAGPRIDQLLDDLHAIPDSIALIEDELRYSIGQLKGSTP